MGLLGGATGVVIALLAGACGGSSDEAVPDPPATVEIADAPTPTVEPAQPTATPPPTPPPTVTVEPTPTSEPTIEDQVIAAWERYLDLSIQARGGRAVDYSTFIAGDARSGLEAVVSMEAEAGEQVRGTARSLAPSLSFEDAQAVVVTDCVEVDLERVLVDTGEAISTQEAVRSTTARLELIDGEWLVTGVDSGEAVGCAD